MNAIIYTIILLAITLAIIFKDLKKDWKNYLLLTITGIIAAIIVENLLISWGFYHYNVISLSIGHLPIATFFLYFTFLSLVYFIIKMIRKKSKIKIHPLILVFVLSFILGFIYDVIAINFVNYWRYTFGPEIFNVSVFASFAEGFYGILIFYAARVIGFRKLA